MVAPLLTVIDTAEEAEREIRTRSISELCEILRGAYVERGATVKVTVEIQEKHWATIAADYGPLDIVDTRLADAITPDTETLTVSLKRSI